MLNFINDEAFRIWIINMLSEGFPDNAISTGNISKESGLTKLKKTLNELVDYFEKDLE